MLLFYPCIGMGEKQFEYQSNMIPIKEYCKIDSVPTFK